MASGLSERCRNWFLNLSFLALTLGSSIAHGLSQSLCSSQNTGVDSSLVNYAYQSNGQCFDTCKDNYAFAVVQYQNCWCSNYAPADTTSVDSCNKDCPGYPSEKCGSDSHFGYIPLYKKPIGTIGASGSQPLASLSVQAAASSPKVVSSSSTPRSLVSPSSTSRVDVPQLPSTTFLLPSFSSPLSLTTLISSLTSILTLSIQNSPSILKPVTVLETVTRSPPVKISLISVTPSTTPDTTTILATLAKPTTKHVPIPVTPLAPNTPIIRSTHSSTTTTSSTDKTPSTISTWTPTPITSVMTVTGEVKTLTITPTAPPAETASAQPSTDGGFMSHRGKVAGLFAGVGIIIVLMAAAAIWLYMRRRKPSKETQTLASTTGDGTPQRQHSKLSQMGLLGRPSGRRSVPRIDTSYSGADTGGEKTPNETPIDYNRYSYPRIIDQRLEPTALWNPLNEDGSGVSVRSFRDDQDYSRRFLRVANPDDRPSTAEP